MDSRDNGAFAHDEADVTMIAYMLQAAELGKDVIRILSDDTDVFVVLVCWFWKMQLYCSVQMERWNRVVVDIIHHINATCTELGPKCLHLMGMHILSGCDTVSYPFNKGHINALITLQAGDFPGLYHVLGEEDVTSSDLMETGQTFFTALYSQPLGTTISYRNYSRKMGKPMRIMALPPTEANLYLHVCRAHLQMMLWRGADQQVPPMVDITQFGSEVKGCIPSPCVETWSSRSQGSH